MKNVQQFDDLDNKRMEINQEILFFFLWLSLPLATSAQPWPLGKTSVPDDPPFVSSFWTPVIIAF